MIYGDLQFFDIIIFAAVAVFLVYRLRSILGRRTNDKKETLTPNTPPQKQNQTKTETPDLKDNEKKLSIVYESVPNFNHKSFIDGAKNAFEIIITAYHQGDTKTLKPLVSKDVYLAFEKSIVEKSNDPNYQFYSLVVGGVEGASVKDEMIKITLLFISEQLKDNDENSIVKKHDVWTFEKKINSNSPIWILSST